MREWLCNQVPWGIQWLLTIQQWQLPWLNELFKLITDLGGEQISVVLLSLAMWCLDAGLAIRASALFLGNAYLNAILKNLFFIPRPYDSSWMPLNADLRPLRFEDSFSWPSGHSHMATGVWGYLAVHARKRWLSIVCVVLMLLISFSRLYVGVHTPTDVLGGLLVGGLMLAAWVWIEERLVDRLRRLSLTWQLGLVIGISLFLLLLMPIPDVAKRLGAVLGLGGGFIIQNHYVAFSAAGAWRKRALRGLVGLALLLPVYLGLSALSPETTSAWPSMLLAFGRYTLVGGWVAWGIPWLLIRFGLAQRADA